MANMLIGIDLGTTFVKAAAFDADSGDMLANAAAALKVEAAPDGRREQPTPRLDQALGRVMRGLRKALGSKWNEVVGMGLAAQGGSGVIAERATGKALSTMILWSDSRHFPYMAEIAAAKPLKYWRKLGMRDEPGAGLGRLRWFQETQPELLHDANIYAGAGEYVFFKLTGVWRQDAGSASQIGCYDVPNRKLVQEPLDLIDTPLSFVAPMRRGHQTAPLAKVAAKRFGLPPGIPVAGPYFDHEAGYLSAVGVSKSPLQCSLGTAWVGNLILSRKCRWHSPFQLVVPAPVGRGWQIVHPLLTGNSSWDWGLANLVDHRQSRALAKLDDIFAEALLPAAGLLCLPWLARPNPFFAELYGGGSFLGVNPHTSQHDLLRALAAGMAFEFWRVLGDVQEAGVADALVLGGGASKGRCFQQLFAALWSPLPVLGLAPGDEAGARGVVYAFSQEAARARTRPLPAPPAALRERVRDEAQRYAEIMPKLYGHIPIAGTLKIG